jgi:hypothetical protein
LTGRREEIDTDAGLFQQASSGAGGYKAKAYRDLAQRSGKESKADWKLINMLVWDAVEASCPTVATNEDEGEHDSRG